MRPLSGSGARGMMLSSWSEFGVDSFVGRLTATMQGATDTTFYIVAVYFGSVAIKNTRYAIKVGLMADLGGIIASVIVCSMFFKSEEVHLTKKEMATEIVTLWNTDSIDDNELGFIDDDIVFMDKTYDTIANGKKAFVDYGKMMEDSVLIKHIIEVDDEVLLKLQTNKGIEAYKIVYDRGKVVEVVLQGVYTGQ
jgi:hypothetical protein